MHPRQRLAEVLQHPGRFLLQVLRAFRANQGLLLAGAVAYYALLSIVPLFLLMGQFAARGGMSQRMANWLYPRLVAQGHKRIEWNFYADNAVVTAIAKKRGMKVDCRQGECVAYFDLQPTADAIREWLDGLEQLLEAVRNESHTSPGAKL